MYKATYDPNVDPNFSSPGYRPWLNDNYHRPLKTYICPSDPGITGDGRGTIQVASWLDNMALTSYAANAQVFAQTDANGVLLNWQGKARIPASFTDGTSNTIDRVAGGGVHPRHEAEAGGQRGAGRSRRLEEVAAVLTRISHGFSFKDVIGHLSFAVRRGSPRMTNGK